MCKTFCYVKCKICGEIYNSVDDPICPKCKGKPKKLYVYHLSCEKCNLLKITDIEWVNCPYCGEKFKLLKKDPAGR
jgi:RecJ-like exonuclease